MNRLVGKTTIARVAELIAKPFRKAADFCDGPGPWSSSSEIGVADFRSCATEPEHTDVHTGCTGQPSPRRPWLLLCRDPISLCRKEAWFCALGAVYLPSSRVPDQPGRSG